MWFDTIEKRKPTPGYVYVLHAPESQRYKIGRTKDLKNRTQMIGLQLPFAVELIHHIECQDYLQAEAVLHSRYSNKRINGEWFALDPQDIEAIKAIEAM